MDILVRGAMIDDCVGIQHIHRDCKDPWQDAEECVAWVEKRLERGFYIQIAQIGERIVGHGEWIVTDCTEGRYLYLGVLQIDDDFQRRGVGRAMIADAARYAGEHDCMELVTTPEPENTSIIFYEKCGFIKRRAVQRCVLETRSLDGVLSGGEALTAIPQEILPELPFVFGLSQISPRHMWEVCNHKPRMDDRITPAIRFNDGSYAQLSYFIGNDSGLALLWHHNPTREDVNRLLAFGHDHGLKQLDFRFFEKYEPLFEGYHVTTPDTEIYLPVYRT